MTDKSIQALDAEHTLDAMLRAAAQKLGNPIRAHDGSEYLVLPPNYKAERLMNDARLPPWPRAQIEVDDRASLSAYANRYSHSASIIVADYDKMTICARLDWHHENASSQFGDAGADAHSVTLRLRPSEEFSRWDEIEGKLLPQEAFARFLEENAADILHPEAATMIEISRDIEATVGQTFKSSVRLDNGDRRLQFETETRSRTDLVIPQRFTLQIPVWNGEQPSDLTALFRWRAAGSEGILLGFNWHRVEYLRRAHFAAIAVAAAEETGLPVFHGRKL